LDFDKNMSAYIAKADKALERALDIKARPDGCPPQLWDAMRYSVFAGGKRIRPVLFLAAKDAANGKSDDDWRFAAALEMIHAYSLIHDDLPAMDDDDYRRGKPSNHKVYGEAVAILAGDALLNMAYEIMADGGGNTGGNTAAMSEIAAAAGLRGMIGGQTADILSENKETDKDTLLYIHAHKTAALIKAALTAGALFAGADARFTDVMREAGTKLGMAFQIKDDFLDVSAGLETTGKPRGSDARKGKATYVTVFGMERALRDYKELSYGAICLFKSVGAIFLEEMAKKLFERKN
jgi:geranylgeranyl diphosphate synthase type II